MTSAAESFMDTGGSTRCADQEFPSPARSASSQCCDTLMPSRISDDFLQQLQRTTDIHRLRWKAYLKPGAREDANQIREYPVRFTDLDLFDHMNNAVYWSVIEDYLSTTPGLLKAPLRVTIEREAPVRPRRQARDHRAHPPGPLDRQVRAGPG
jgi:Acyl-ACP thioesterase